MSDALEQELLELNQKLVDCITEGDWQTYKELCHPSLTAFEPEALGHRVDGLDFHHYYFQFGGIKGAHQTLLVEPHVRIMGDVAVVAYVRLIQKLDANREPQTISFEETRVWQKMEDRWQHVHFHRTAIPMRWSSS